MRALTPQKNTEREHLSFSLPPFYLFTLNSNSTRRTTLKTQELLGAFPLLPEVERVRVPLVAPQDAPLPEAAEHQHAVPQRVERRQRAVVARHRGQRGGMERRGVASSATVQK